MTTHAFTWLLQVLAVVIVQTPTPVPTPTGPAGHWAGSIQVPGQALDIEVDLAARRPNTWEGTITIPAQHLKALPLSGVSVEGTAVTFGMTTVPGAPVFKGMLSKDSRSIAGNFTQAGSTMPFSLAWKGEPRIETPPANKPIDKEFEGAWEGALDAGGTRLRLVLKLSNQEGAAIGSLVSVDQGNVELPVSSIVQAASHLTIAVPTIGGTFEGDLKDGRLEGAWVQGGAPLPLVFARSSR